MFMFVCVMNKDALNLGKERDQIEVNQFDLFMEMRENGERRHAQKLPLVKNLGDRADKDASFIDCEIT